jgi:hypothetical protein
VESTQFQTPEVRAIVMGEARSCMKLQDKIKELTTAK